MGRERMLRIPSMSDESTDKSVKERAPQRTEEGVEHGVKLTREQQQQGQWKCLWCAGWFDRFVGLRSHLVGCLERVRASTNGKELAVRVTHTHSKGIIPHPY